ncbi:FERM and PDZ domain-containing protein 4 isoform X2 [Xyrichtys novacula]|uniref:FERM and PDZ domain-containing protein 4 isoform X2 n=1 Tax=Xyrichtys novacula TaxID=13765 RepID=A0AAV1H113_XYRNO|nr:FERM and PDZ domain-containing protein 4 isoform X2 [Xyrichtys novacula]
MPGSRNLEALFEKTKTSLKGKSGGQSEQSQDPPKVQRIFSAKTLPKSFSQGSVPLNPSGRGMTRGASLSLPKSATTRLDAAAWRCRGPFSHCFLRRKSNSDGHDEDRQTPSHTLFSVSVSRRENAVLKAEQSSAAAAMDDRSLKARLDRVNSMKGKTYSLHTGFALARKDALDMVSILRSSLDHVSRGEKPEVSEADMDTHSQLLLMQAKVLGRACTQMAIEYSSPEELLLTLTHSFHTLCCLAQACMSLVEGLSSEKERREVVAKVDEAVMNYVCLLKAAEMASGGSPGDQSVNALTHHSTTMSTIINTLTHSLQTLLRK